MPTYKPYYNNRTRTTQRRGETSTVSSKAETSFDGRQTITEKVRPTDVRSTEEHPEVVTTRTSDDVVVVKFTATFANVTLPPAPSP